MVEVEATARDKIYLYRPVLKRMSAFWQSLTVPGKCGLGIVLFTVALGLLAPYVTWHSPDVATGPALLPPGEGHLLGTDDMGVDLWAQICYGARTSLLIGAATALLAGLGGGIVGILAGYAGGMVEKFILRLIDVLLVLPDLPLLILLAAFLGAGLENIIVVLALFSWSRPARIVRAQVLSLRQQTYIQAARHYGAGTFYLLWRHFLPELMPLLLVHMVRLASRGITAEAGLAFLGLGDPTANSWGMILHYATGFRGIYFTPYWKWWLLYPWLALTLLVIGLALFGRDLERITDPRLRFRRPVV